MPSSSNALSASTVYSRCWDCIVKQRTTHTDGLNPSSRLWRSHTRTRTTTGNTTQFRRIHNGTRIRQQFATNTTSTHDELPPPEVTRVPIRERLSKWQAEHGNPLSDLIGLDTAFGIRNVVADSYGEQKRNEAEQDPKNDDDEDEGIPLVQFDQEATQYGGMYLQMGDLVELRSSRAHAPPMLAVFVRILTLRQVQLVTMRGKWVVVEQGQILFSVPNFIDQKLVSPIVPYLPRAEVLDEILGQTHIFDSSVPREITAPVINLLTTFYNASETVYRKYAAVLDNAHDALAHATDLRFGTLDRITDRLVGQEPGIPRMAAMYAVRKALLGSGMGFGIDKRSHRQTGVFQIRSKEQLQYVTEATKWLREYQEYEVAKTIAEDPEDARHALPRETNGVKIVKSFVDKARLAIIDSRKHRSGLHIARGAIGPSDKRFDIKSERGTLRWVRRTTFDDNDRVLIRVLEYAGVQGVLETEETMQSLLPLLLRGTGLYQESEHEVQLGKRSFFTFLLELGVFAPFEDVTRYDVNLLLPSSQHSKPLQQLASTLEQLDITKVDLRDQYADIRKDWSGTTAYAIDSEGSHEIDDAISITKIPGTELKAWVHIHIANPTAFITRDSPFARMAAHLTESFYSPDYNVALLPNWLSQEMFSLRTGRPCLTVSALLDDQGTILDVKLEHGKLGEVVSLSYSQLPEILGTEAKERTMKPMVIGGEIPIKLSSKPPTTISQKHRDELSFLSKFSQARVGHRVRAGGFPYSFGQPDVSVFSISEKVGLPEMFPRRAIGCRVDGDPIIAIYPKPYENPFTLEQPAHMHLVQEMMLVAGDAFSRWCYQRDIPLAYRSMADVPGMPTYKQSYEKHIRGAIEEFGHIPVGIGFKFLQTAGRGAMTTKPARHPSLGLEYYTKCTSPLRRYGDMISHWQAEAALREEARSGHNSLISKTALSPKNYDHLPFNYPQMENIISRLHPREALISMSKSRSVRHWISHFMFRAYYFEEYPLPKTFKIVVLRQSQVQFEKSFCMVTWMDTGLVLKCLHVDENGTLLEYGDVWEVEIDGVVPFYPDVILKPLRRISQEAGV